MVKHDIYQKELPHRAVTVYVYLADRSNRQGECWPAINTIARDLKLSPSTVRRALRDLRKAGVIESEQRYRQRRQEQPALQTGRAVTRKSTTVTNKGQLCPLASDRWYLSW